ncbi:hypothetical protein ACFQHO_18170 [Actinomadura yumaensis]|uniref:hypothetical protein n=1 Tax=Actinomadura yumaensis TaxID=111807 RepID=UPI0036187804
MTELFDRITVPGLPLVRAMGGRHATPERLRHYRLWHEAMTKVITELRTPADPRTSRTPRSWPTPSSTPPAPTSSTDSPKPACPWPK